MSTNIKVSVEETSSHHALVRVEVTQEGEGPRMKLSHGLLCELAQRQLAEQDGIKYGQAMGRYPFELAEFNRRGSGVTRRGSNSILEVRFERVADRTAEQSLNDTLRGMHRRR